LAVLRFFIFSLITCASLISFAQVKVSSSKPVRLEYKSKIWNKNTSEVDYAGVLLRDTNSKKMVRVQLQETDVNTSVFHGNYSVTFGEQELTPEIYFPPQSLLKNLDQLKTIEAMIKDGSLLRKPYFIRDEGKGSHILTIFDTKEQAVAALEEYRRLRSQTKSPIGEAALLAQAQAAKEKELRENALMAMKQNDERQKIELEEKARQEALLKQQEQLNAAEKARRQAEAARIAQQGLDFYDKGKYPDAEIMFSKAIEMDPSNKSFNFQYGVSLYRNGNFNKSLAVLKLAEGTGVNIAEKEFFIASNHMKLKENETAIQYFESVKKRNDKAIGPASAFYAGVLQYQLEKFDESKANFEFVLDNSEDKDLDSQAEAYIEQIANAIAFKKEQAKKFIISANLGLMYDSNILAIAKSQLDQQTELAGYRWAYGASLEYRHLYTYVHDFSVIASISDMYSTNKSFAAEKSFQNTDPLAATVYLPYRYKGKAFDKGYQMTLSPGFETTMMNADETGSRETITDAMVLKNDHTFIMNNTWFATYSFEYRSETSKIESTNGTDDDLNASKITLGTTQTFFQNDKKTEAWIGELGASQNTAKGVNATFTRFDFAATYMSPWKWDTIVTTRLALFYADYSKHTVGRKDTDSALTFSLIKPLSETVSSNISATYTNNASTLESSDYSKYVIMTGLSWTTSL
jgi:hypothetical protein